METSVKEAALKALKNNEKTLARGIVEMFSCCSENTEEESSGQVYKKLKSLLLINGAFETKTKFNFRSGSTTIKVGDNSRLYALFVPPRKTTTTYDWVELNRKEDLFFLISVYKQILKMNKGALARDLHIKDSEVFHKLVEDMIK